MFAHRRKAWGLSIAAVMMGVTSSAAALPGGSARELGATGVSCAEARAGIERLEGRITPNVCAFLERQLAFGRMATGTPPSAGQTPQEAVTHPRVAAYLDIFDPEATLWEAGSTPKTGRLVIGAAIAGSLRMVPDLYYTGTDVVADGGTVMFGQWNTATVKGHTVAYPQIARNVLGDEGRTIQARRYYDRHVLVRDILPNAPKGLFDGIADHGTSPARRSAPARVTADSLPARLAAWNTGNTDALLRRAAGTRLAGPGLAKPLATKAGKQAYLKRLFGKADLNLKAGQVAFGTSTTYIEWHGTVTRKHATAGEEQNQAVPFGIVERFGPDGQWELYFDTLPVLTDPATINNLLAQLATP